MRITHHNYDTEFCHEEGERAAIRHLDIHKQFLKSDMNRIFMFSDTCVRAFHYYQFIAPDQPKAIEHFFLYQRAKAAYLQLAMTEPGVEHELRFNHEWTFHIKSAVVRSHTDTGYWQTALMTSLIARNHAAVQSLLNFSVERMRNATAKGPEYTFLYADFMHAAFRGEPDAGQKLLTAYKATDPSMMWESYVDVMLKMDVPEMDLWTCYLSNDPKGFNEKLAVALELNKELESRTPKNIYTLVNYPLTCFASMAYERGWELTVSSDYMPEWMIKGEFWGIDKL